MRSEDKNNIFFRLLNDELFIRWIIHPTAETDLYWEKKAESDQELTKNIRTLKKILENLKFEEPELTPDQKKMIWSKIEESTVNRNSRQRTVRRTLVKAASVAAVLALIAVNLWFFTYYNKKGDGIDYTAIINDKNDFDLSAGDVTLVFSDNRQVNMQSDSAEVIYDAEGRVKVNSEVIESGENLSAVPNQLIVPYGKTTFLTLSDGTKVWINSGSKMIYPSVFDTKKREVFITGEAYFDVAKNEKQPFIIKTDQMDVTVRGTRLNVSAYAGEKAQTVVLVSGAVDVRGNGEKNTYKMRPDQLLSYDASSKEIDVKHVDVNNYVSWINGYLLLTSESLDKVLVKIDRHYNTHSKYNKRDLENIRVSGKLDLKKDIGKVFEYLAAAAPITYTIEDKSITVKLKR